jgi:predicted amidophosphoribosyltransferase
MTSLDFNYKLSVACEYYCKWREKDIEVTLSLAEFKRPIGFYNVLDPKICETCGNPNLFRIDGKLTCLEHYLHSRLEHTDGVFQVGNYYNKSSFKRKDPNDLLNDHIWKLKTKPEYANPLAQAMMLVIERNFPALLNANTIVPVPNYGNSERDLKASGLAAELEKCLKKQERNINLKNYLVKLKNDKIHSYMDRAGREKSVEDMFGFDKSMSIHGEKIILVDDVLTAGNVKGECARILKEQGAEKVWIMTVGRTV